MAINVPDCEVLIAQYVIKLLSNQSNFTPNEVEQMIRNYIGPCEDQLFSYMPDSYVYSLIALYCVIMPIGFFGNLAIILLIATTPKLQKSINFLLMSLAVSDFILTIFQPWTLIHNISYGYPYGNDLCRAIPPIQGKLMKDLVLLLFSRSENGYFLFLGTAVASSIYVLVIMAVERHQAVIYPTHDRVLSSKTNMAVCIAIMWCVALCFQVHKLVLLPDNTNI